MMAGWQLQLLTLVGHLLTILAADRDAPSLSHSLTTPLVKVEGDDALLTCVVQNQLNLTLVWKKTIEHIGTKILTANTARVTSDQRFSVIHEQGGQVYVLLIRNITLKDAGMYICELNTPNVTQSFHELKVISDRLLAPVVASDHLDEVTDDNDDKAATRDSIDVWNYSTERPINHDYSDCCISKNVTKSCLGFCSIKNILDGNTGTNPTECETDFPNIVSCMADGRDHLPCCLDQGIPEACSDLCRGEYTPQSDSIKSLFSCAIYTAPTLACIAVGTETLPKQPEGFSVESVNDTAIRVSWEKSAKNEKFTDNYVINVTYIQFLSPVFSVKVDTETAKKIYPPHSKLYKAKRGESEIVIGNLEVFSLYEVSMLAENKFGKSLPTYEVKVVTHLKGETAPAAPDVDSNPDIPDIKSCCVANNVSHPTCIDKFCDPRNVGNAELTDMMICAPWDTEMFSCLAGGKDHRPCCARRGVPALCQELCSGNVTDINFKYFHCLSYMTHLSSCLLEGYEVLPSSPINFRFSNVETSYGILHWDPPETRGDTVQHYVVTYEQLTPKHTPPQTIDHARSPFILENLEPGSTYEVYVAGINSAGVGESSTRIVFRTARKTIDDLVIEDAHPYDQNDCCIKSGVKSECLPLCSYNASVTQVKSLAGVCEDDFTKVIRCSAGGRDHLPCCARRGVPTQCQPLCQAVHQQSTGADFKQCLPNIGQIILCYEEGTILLPPPIKNLRALSVTDGGVMLGWQPGSVMDSLDEETKLGPPIPSTQFEVYYKMVGENSTSGTVFESDHQLNTTAPIININNLTKGGLYKFYVVSRNAEGTSLPSSILTLNVSKDAWDGVSIQGSSSPPHLLEVSSHSATWLKFSWNPPAISHPEDNLKYRLYYRQVSSNISNFYTVETDVTTVKLKDLAPNTQYALYTTAIIAKNDSKSVESSPSETLIAWTDPAFPAFVEAPTIHPIDQVLVGSSMKVLCIAMGTPPPHVTLYLNGHPLRTEVTRHMVTNIHNVTTDMEHVSCYADNGYGTPMIASRKITISRGPAIIRSVQAGAGPTLVGDTAVITCKVDAWPAPNLAIFTDKELKHTVSNSDRVLLNAGSDEEDPAKFHITMKIMNVRMEDAGVYYCHANSSLGDDVSSVNLKVTETPPSIIDVTQCCQDNNVSARCMDICSFSLDYDLMAARPDCLPEFHKMMTCASDGSDHRHCCSTSGVPSECLDWCRGQPVDDEHSEICAISHSATITDCFHKGRDNLPGLPLNVTVRGIDAHKAMVWWNLPEKNPGSVDLYRVFWRPVGSKSVNKTDSIQRKVTLTDLTPGVPYEVVVKAGNSNGTSQLTKPVQFRTANHFIITSSSPRHGADVGGAVGIAFAVIFVIVLVVVVVYLLKKKNLIILSVKKPESPTVSFENPFYTSRDTSSNMQTISGGDEYNVHISSSGSWQSEMSSTPSSSDRSSPSSGASPSTPNTHHREAEVEEDSPSVYQQIQMGLTGQNGFRRFK